MKICPGCDGHKIRYQLEAQFGGDHLSARDWLRMGRPLAMKVTCGTCNGTGKVPE